jgi:anti-sigma regulatory factor (Ser/Thr protein kinase)
MSEVAGEPCVGSAIGWTFACSPRSPRAARSRVEEQLAWWGVALPHATRALMVLTELVANAVLHAGTPVHVSLTFLGSTVVIRVSDGSGCAPLIPDAGPVPSQSFGLWLVGSLALTLDWSPATWGKTVTAVVRIDQA